MAVLRQRRVVVLLGGGRFRQVVVIVPFLVRVCLRDQAVRRRYLQPLYPVLPDALHQEFQLLRQHAERLETKRSQLKTIRRER